MLWVRVQITFHIGSIAASEVGNSIFIIVTRPKHMFRRKSKFFFGREKPRKSDKNFRHLSLNMVAKRDHESFKCFSLLWLKEMPFLLRRNVFRRYRLFSWYSIGLLIWRPWARVPYCAQIALISLTFCEMHPNFNIHSWVTFSKRKTFWDQLLFTLRSLLVWLN